MLKAQDWQEMVLGASSSFDSSLAVSVEMEGQNLPRGWYWRRIWYTLTPTTLVDTSKNRLTCDALLAFTDSRNGRGTVDDSVIVFISFSSIHLQLPWFRHCDPCRLFDPFPTAGNSVVLVFIEPQKFSMWVTFKSPCWFCVGNFSFIVPFSRKHLPMSSSSFTNLYSTTGEVCSQGNAESLFRHMLRAFDSFAFTSKRN